MRLILRTFILCMALLLVSGCEKKTPPIPEDGRPIVVASTTMLTDLARQIGGDAVRVEGIMSPGGDPHLYQPTPKDARLVASSHLVIKSGLHLEGWIDDLLDNAGGTRPTVVASQGITPLHMEGFAGGVDPHFWFDLQAWTIASRNVGRALISLVGKDTPKGEAIRQRLDAYLQLIGRLDVWVRDRLSGIPKEQRILVSSHDAFNYFGKAYNIEVVGVQGISTDQKASQRDVANIIEKIKKHKVRTVFVETSVNPALIEQVARETGASIEGPLYSDSIGAADGPAGTFVGTMVENVRMIGKALGGDYREFRLEP